MTIKEYNTIEYVACHLEVVMYTLGFIASAMGFIQSIIYTFNNQSQLHRIFIFAILGIVCQSAWKYSIKKLSYMKKMKKLKGENND